MITRMIVAAAQMNVTDDTERNLRSILRFMEKAAKMRSDIVCFPEACLVSDEKNAVSITRHLRAIESKCKELSIWCIFCSYKKERNKVRNLAFVIDRRGRLIYQ